MKKSTMVFVVLCCLSAILDVGCGGGSSNTPKVSKLAKRAFVVVISSGSNVIDILDATKDHFTAFTIQLFGSHASLVQPGASNTTLVFSSGTGDNTLSIVDNTKEKVSNSATPIQLAGSTESMVESSDAKTIYAAVRSTSQVYTIDVASASVNSTSITVPSVRRLVLAHNNSKLLAFSDNLDTFTVINADKSKACGLPDANPPTFPSCGAISRPFYAVLSSDDTKAYVLNCGPECGGNIAGVTVVDMTQNPPNIGATLPVSAATVALMDSGNLYVAGTDGAGNGHLDIVNLSSFTVTKSIPIGNGFHSLISLASNNKLFVGAKTCSTSCLSIVDVSAGTAVIDSSSGDVTGIAPIPARNVVYVTVGGELRMIDTNTSKPQANQLDTPGIAAGVVVP